MNRKPAFGGGLTSRRAAGTVHVAGVPGPRPMRVGREDVMGAAPFVLVLVGLVIPIGLVLLAVVADLLTAVWVLYVLWYDTWSAPTERKTVRVQSSRLVYHH